MTLFLIFIKSRKRFIINISLFSVTSMIPMKIMRRSCLISFQRCLFMNHKKGQRCKNVYSTRSSLHSTPGLKVLSVSVVTETDPTVWVGDKQLCKHYWSELIFFGIIEKCPCYCVLTWNYSFQVCLLFNGVYLVWC